MQTLRQPRTSRARGLDSLPGVMFFINDLGMGGAERALVNLVNNANRFRPVIAVLRPVLDLAAEVHPDIQIVCVGPDAVERSDVTPVTPRGYPRGQMILEIPGLLRTARRLARAARAANCTVVSTFLNRAHTVALTARILVAPDLRVVINVHELLSDHLDLHFAPIERRIMKEFITRVFPRAERIVTVADAVTADLVNNFDLRPERMSVIHNPVDRIRIGRAGKVSVGAKLSTGNTIVAVGRLVWLKGFDILIRAVASLPAALDARLLIVGEGVERRKLESLIAELGVGDRVTLIGLHPNPWQYMARARVLVVPSRTEAFPTVIGEAFALAVPVVATRCSEGVADYLDHGRCGILVPPENVSALATALERILLDPVLRNGLGAAGKRRVEAFDMPLAVRRYEDLIAEVLAPKPVAAFA